jgi:L-ascorbate metabolism protein UlaG (beta-lactamase superfamily)
MVLMQALVLPQAGVKADFDTGSIFFVGTATVLVRYAGFTFLTDPNFLHRGDHVHLGYGLQSRRLTDPAMEIDTLPPLDFVMLSHMHEDHFDRVATEKLDKTVPIITTRHAAADLKTKGFQAAQGLRPWEGLRITKDDAVVQITSMPGKHAPGILSALLPPVMGSMLEFLNSTGTVMFRLYITGDTLIHGRLKEIPHRYPNIDLALVHLGGTRIFGIMLTMDGNQGVQLLQIVAPRMAIPIHYNDYTVFRSPLEDFQQAVQEAGLKQRVTYLSHGETYQFRASRAGQ